jgi:16S rRNA (guanine1516-N2)-methyltransferase
MLSAARCAYMTNINIAYSSSQFKQRAEQTALKLNLPLIELPENTDPKSCPGDLFTSKDDYLLFFSEQGLTLVPIVKNAGGMVRCDFVTGSNRHRMNYGGGNGQSIAKAVGVSGKFQPQVLDVTAGLGRDAFVLAGLGCNLLMLERNPVVYNLLEDGLLRAQLAAQADAELDAIIGRMQLLNTESSDYLDSSDTVDQPDVIYMDPMFPLRKKSAKVKKDMQALHSIVGADEDSGQILDKALANARYRVVVKRPAHAGFLADTKPTYSLDGKSTRFDIFALQKLPS